MALPINTFDVGHTADAHEVVVNHPDLKPDAEGVGHVVLSVAQAQAFAALLIKHAVEAASEARQADLETRYPVKR